MPFEIFSAEEITRLMSHTQAAESYAEPLKYLINRMNYGVCSADGWLGKLKKRAEELKDDTEREHVLAGVIRYAEVANTLQKNPEGELTSGFLPKKFAALKKPERYGIEIKQTDIAEATSKILVEVQTKYYQHFWDGYLKEVLNTYIDSLNNKNILSHKQLTKPILYLFSRLKNTIQDDRVFNNTSYRNGVEDYIKAQTRMLRDQTHLPCSFSLSEEEVQFMEAEKKFILRRIREIFSLRKQFEADPVLIRYVHVHPHILVQLAQMLDYFCHHMADMAKVGLFKKTISRKDAEVLEILNKKRQEIAVVMAFQEKLYEKYGRGDFIQVLQHLFADAKTDFLPQQAFYDFAENASIAIATYEEGESAPKLLGKEECIRWKMNCKFLLAAKASGVSLPARAEEKKEVVLRRPKEPDLNPFCGGHTRLHFVENNVALLAYVPNFVVSTLFAARHLESKESVPAKTTSRFFSLKKLVGMNSVSTSVSSASLAAPTHMTNEVFNFFIHQNQSRNDFMSCLLLFKDTLAFSKRKTLCYKSLLFMFVIPPASEQFTRPRGVLLHLQDLVHQKRNMEKYFEDEYELLAIALSKPISADERRVFMAYQAALDEARIDLSNTLEPLLLSWDEKLRETSIIPSALLDESVATFEAHLNSLRR